MNIAEVLSENVRQRPQAIAIIDGEGSGQRHVTLAELEWSASRVARLLHDTGLRRGDTVLVFHPMSAELYLVLTAIFRLGLVAMFVDPSTGRDHVQRSCVMRPPKGMIASAKAHVLRFLSPAVRRIPYKFSVGSRIPGAVSLLSARRLPGLDTIEPCEPHDPALITFTSGSGDQPKAALRSHGFLLAQHRAIERSLDLQPEEIELVTQPIFVLANLASGVTSVIPNVDLRRPDTVDPARLAQPIERHQATRASASPALLERLAEHCLDANTPLLSLKKIFTGGGPVYPELIERLRQVAPRATITAVYGSTEAEPIACIDHRKIRAEDVAVTQAGHGLLAGHPVAMIDLRILINRWGESVGPFTSETFDAACRPTGKPGEIVVSGLHVLSTYLRADDEQYTKFDVEGIRWHRTGDAGYLDERGRLWLLGRCAGCIEGPHDTLFPFHVECAARQHGWVRHAAVISIRGQRVLAVEPRPGRLPNAHLTAMLNSLEFARIKQVRLLKKMPVDRRHNAKIDYAVLQSLLEKTL